MPKKGKNAVVVNVNTGKAKRRTKQKNKQSTDVTALGQLIRYMGGVGGHAAAGYLGVNQGLGASIGTGLGAVISRWLGQGDYRIASNTIVNSYQNASTSIPAMHKSNQSITVRHREYLAPITGSTGFNVSRFFILQPGDTNTFPWLSQLAPMFQQYRIKGMVFHYVPTSGSAVSGTNPALGTVMIQTSYRANDVAPRSKVEMMNEYWACESSPDQAFCHPIECSPKENPFNVHYTRTVAPPTSDSPLLYDMGVTYVATSGMPASGNPVGDLWVTYEIEFSKPLVTSSITPMVDFATVATTSPTTGAWFGGTATYGTANTLAISVVGSTLIFPIGLVGTFQVMAEIAGSFSDINLSGAGTSSGLTAASYSRTVMTSGTSTLQRAYYFASLVLADPSVSATFTYPTATWSGTATSAVVTVCRSA